MRRSADPQLDDLARRRLDALIAELGGRPQEDSAAGGQPPTSRVWDEEPPHRGRHAHRPLSTSARIAGWLEDRLPETLRGRVRIGPAQLGVVSLLLAGALVWGGWTATRVAGDQAPGSPPLVVTSSTAASPPPASAAPVSPGASATPMAAASPAAASELVVDVQGTVRRPGIVVLPLGSRVVDALKSAGGYTGRQRRLASVNLARPLVDGEQIVLGRAVPAAAPGGGGVQASPGASGAGELVSLNSADQTALETLPGVGPVTASAILQWREENGPFTAVEQLLEVSGIGEKTLAQISPFVTL
jgi:competence protein ComEA